MKLLKSDIVSLHGAAISMQGGRPENQDDMTFLDTPLGFLAVVCDGMGGGPGGKTASYIAKYEIANTICSCTPQTSMEHALKMAVACANEALENKMQEVASLKGMGSTFVAVLINKNSAYIAHAGDSRCYLLRKGKCVYRTQDHSLVGELVRKKALTEEEARISPQSNVISRGLGSTTNHVPEIEEVPFKKGDRIVLCTDGVWGAMPQKELVKRFVQQSDIQQIVSNVSSEIDKIGYLDGGHHDNHTIAIFDVELNSVLKTKISWTRLAVACSLIFFAVAIIVCIIIFASKKDKGSNIAYVRTTISDNSHSSGSQTSFSSTYAPTSDENEKKEGNLSDSVSTRTKESNTDSVLKQLEKELHSVRRDSIVQKKDTSSYSKDFQVYDSPAETIQKVITLYNSAKVVEGVTVEEAQKKLDELHKDIKSLMNDLLEQCKNNNVLSVVEAINRVVDNKNSWYIDRVKDERTGKYVVTQASKILLEKQIKRLTELKSKL